MKILFFTICCIYNLLLFVLNYQEVVASYRWEAMAGWQITDPVCDSRVWDEWYMGFDTLHLDRIPNITKGPPQSHIYLFSQLSLSISLLFSHSSLTHTYTDKRNTHLLVISFYLLLLEWSICKWLGNLAPNVIHLGQFKFYLYFLKLY